MSNDTLIGGNATVATHSSDELTIEAIESFDSDRDIFVFKKDDSFQYGEIDILEGFDVANDAIELRFDFSEDFMKSDRQYDYFKEAMTKELQSSFFQDGADTYIGSREDLNDGLGSLGTNIDRSYIVLKNVDIDKLNSNNFRFVDTN